jgi:hypothetical protein
LRNWRGAGSDLALSTDLFFWDGEILVDSDVAAACDPFPRINAGN